jgi:hypothetical protein
MIDTSITHITKAGSNLFSELGFDDAQAQLLHAQSQQNINDATLLKEQLMNELSAKLLS